MGSALLERSRAAEVQQTHAHLGEQVREQAEKAVQEQLAALEARAQQAGSLPVLRAQVGAVNWNTLRDGFTTEAGAGVGNHTSFAQSVQPLE